MNDYNEHNNQVKGYINFEVSIMNFCKEIFCSNLTKLREAKGYNKYEMSIQANIHYTYYLDIENGKMIPNFKGLVSIANALDTDIAHLLNEQSDSNTEILKREILSKLSKVKECALLNQLYKIAITIKLWKDVNNHD